MKLCLTIALMSVLAHCAVGHVQTSDLEDNEYLSLEKLLTFKEKNMLANKKLVTQPHQTGYSLYSYDGGPGTSNWHGLCSSGKAQSPVDFNRADTKETVSRILRFSGSHQIPMSTNITNSAHSVKVKLRTQKPITVTGGVFGNKVYEFQQMHFHWGLDMETGSEHTISSKRFPLEGHFVFYKTNTKNPTTEPDGIAVLSVLYEASPKDNKILDFIVKTVNDIKEPENFVNRPAGHPFALYLPADLRTYFNYRGSLTTPPCTEGVNWVVFTERLTVSQNQVRQFGTIRDELGNEVVYNFRELQPLNGRQINLVQSSERIVS